MLNKIVTYRALVLAVVAFAELLILAAAALMRGTPIQASPPASANATGPQTTWTCTPDEVAVFPDRIHVHCTVGQLGIYYFAVPTSDQAAAARYLSIFTTGFALGKTVLVYYGVTDASGTAFGCLYTDCRAITGASVY